uniref:Uncharacterized protein n=1 Tax=Rhizophora mucronata TaxID=61149 RepID=A0A2P2L0T4_RHIMU
MSYLHLKGLQATFLSSILCFDCFQTVKVGPLCIGLWTVATSRLSKFLLDGILI